MKAEHDPKKSDPNAVRTVGVQKWRTVTKTSASGVERTVRESYIEEIDYTHFDYLHHPDVEQDTTEEDDE